MGMFSFIEESGEILSGTTGKAQATGPSAAKAATADQLSQTAGEAIASNIDSMGLKVEALGVNDDGAPKIVTVAGRAPDQLTRENDVLCCCNVASMSSIMTVATPEPESKPCTMVKGDNLSKISKAFSGTPNRYPQIFETNKPMMNQPEEFFPVRYCGFLPPEAP